MNIGILTERYAKALLMYVQETGNGDRVCKQVKLMLRHPEMHFAGMEPELIQFGKLLVNHGRVDLLRFILYTFLDMYYKSKGTKVVHLTTAIPSEEWERKLARILEKRFGCKVVLESTVDPSLLGGFILKVGDKMIDASVRGQIEAVRRQFIVQNNRIV